MDTDQVRERLRPATIKVEEAARILGLSRNAAYEAARTGALPSIRLGKRIFIPTAHLRKMLGLVTA